MTTTTSSAEFQGRPTEGSSTDTPRQTDARQVARALANHPILPSSEVPLQDESLQHLLADLARGERSSHADVLREASEEQGVLLEEIARRAQFMLACLLLPASGTFYEVIGVAPRASAAEIRQRWTAAIRRYHPDHFGGQNSWLDAQARRLIEAYETLRDPERRREYDADLARLGPRVHFPMGAGGEETGRARRRRFGWRLGILVLVLVVVGLWVRTRLATELAALTPAPVPPSPRLLETFRSRFLVPPPADRAPAHAPAAAVEPHDTGVAPPVPSAAAPAPERESKASRAAARPVGPADWDRDRRAARLLAAEPDRASPDGSHSEAQPAAPRATGRPTDTTRTDR